MQYKLILIFIALLLLVRLSVPAQTPAGSWAYYGQDAGGNRYSSLKQINDKNVGRLAVAWTYRTGELKTYEGTSAAEKAAFETTPILIGRTLYFSTPSDRVIAVDAATGQQRWVYDPEVNLRQDHSEISSRGVAAWKGSRIFIGTIDGWLIALDAATGHLIASFGQDGKVNLKTGLGPDVAETSPPTVIGDLVIVGSSLGDNQRFDMPPGTVRAFDARTGQLVWSWDPIPQDSADSAYATWQGPKAHRTGGANAWTILSADPARDMLFVPTTCASPDYYGGERIGRNQYANSIVALRASTGKMLWSYQVVHHDLWDFDIAAQPILADIDKGGRKVPAVIVGTKMGYIFVLDRKTGVPLFRCKNDRCPRPLCLVSRPGRLSLFPSCLRRWGYRG